MSHVVDASGKISGTFAKSTYGRSGLLVVRDVSLSAKWQFDVCANTFSARKVTKHGFKLRSGFGT